MRNRTQVLALALVAALGATTVAAGSHQEDTDLASGLSSLLEDALAGEADAALALQVTVDGEVVFAAGRGGSRPRSRDVARVGTPFGAGSMAHAFLVTVAEQLEQADELSHEDLLTTHVPELVPENCPVRVGELLAHTSGLPDYREFAPAESFLEGTPTYVELAKSVREQPAESAPGECVADNATDTLLLAAVLEAVAKKPVEELLQERVFDLLEMDDTRYALDADAKAEEASAADELPLAFLPRGLVSTTADLARFGDGLTDLVLVGHEAWQGMRAPTRLADGSSVNSGRGLRLVRQNGADGWVLGEGEGEFAARVAAYPSLGLEVAVMARGDVEVDGLVHDVAGLVAAKPGVELLDLPLDGDQLAIYCGNYQTGCNMLVITSDEGRLVLEQVDREPIVLLNQGEHRFVGRDANVKLVFELLDGIAQAFELEQDGMTSRATRFR